MSERANVVMCAIPGGVRERAWAALVADWPPAVLREHDAADDYSYGKLLRLLWREPGDLVQVEQDVVVPAGSVRELLACPEPWCTHPHWVGERHSNYTLGLVKFAAGLRANFPSLADRALGAYDPRMAASMGLTRHLPIEIGAPGWRRSARAAFKPGAPNPWDGPPAAWPTTAHHAIGIDSSLLMAIVAVGIRPHVHQPPTLHLREYSEDPDTRGVAGRPDPRLPAGSGD